MSEEKQLSTVTQQISQPAQPPVIEKEFELEVYDVSLNDTGKEEYRRVSFEEPIIIKVKSPAELTQRLELFKNCGQVAKVKRLISEKTIGGPVTLTQNVDKPVQQQPTQQQIVQNAQHIAPQIVEQTIASQQEIVVQKPRFFKVGNIEVKEQNGKIYQKQWMKLSEYEASNIRVVNDKNNSTVNLSGKHIEMKKWVLVEDSTSSDELEKLQENL